jgi:phage terminase large subunit-like protein
MQLLIANRHGRGIRRQKQRNIRAYYRARDLQNQLYRDLILNDNRLDVLCKLIGLDFDPFHQNLIYHQEQNETTLQLGPRFWGKTTIGTIVSASGRVIKDRNARILIASETVTQAKDILDAIKNILTNTRVVEIFGNFVGKVWNDDEILVEGRTVTWREKTIMTTGTDGAITGCHFKDIYGDDLVSLKNSRTAHNRGKVKDWYYATLFPCILGEGTRLRVSGTRYHPDDLYNHLMKHDPMFRDTTSIIPALIDGESNNPTSISTEFLLKMKESMGHIHFNAQMMLDANALQGDIFDDRFFIHKKHSPAKMLMFTGVDLAIGEEAKDSEFAIVTIGLDLVSKTVWLLKWASGHFTLDQQDDQILSHYEDMDPVAVGIESNAFQKSKVKDLKRKKKTSFIPAIPIHTDKDKRTRGQRLAVYYERSEIIHLECDKGSKFEEQLLNYPDGKYNDLVDALDIAIRTMFRKKKKKSNRKEPGVLSAGQRYTH